MLEQKAHALLQLRQYVSRAVILDFEKYNEMKIGEWYQEFNNLSKFLCPNCPSQERQLAIEDVFIAYGNKRTKYLENTDIRLTRRRVEYYKRNGKTYKIGDIKEVYNDKVSTAFTKCLSHLVKYYSPEYIEYIREVVAHGSEGLSKADLGKFMFRKSIINYLDRFGERLVRLSLEIRNRILKRLTEYSIDFSSLTYRSCSRLKDDFVQENTNADSIFNAVLVLGGQPTDSGKMIIPVKHHSKIHGNVSDYNKDITFDDNGKPKQRNISYLVQLPRRNRVRIILTKAAPDVLPARDKVNYLGVDVNTKHNLFAFPDENTIDYDRDLLLRFIDFLIMCDRKIGLRTARGEYRPRMSSRNKVHYARWMIRIRTMLLGKCSELLHYAVNNGHDHIVMEDLATFARSYLKSDNFKGIKVSRLISLLGLSALKEKIKHMAKRFDVQVTFTHPHFTSQACECGHVHRDNRKEQETFSCVECGNTQPADAHSAGMIEDRVADEVLRDMLHNTDEFGQISPKKLSAKSIKSIIHRRYSDKYRAGNPEIACENRDHFTHFL